MKRTRPLAASFVLALALSASPDATTLALYHFDEATGTSLGDASIGGTDGTIFVGGSAPAGPVWSDWPQTPWSKPWWNLRRRRP